MIPDTLIPVTDTVQLRNRGIGFTALCTALLPPDVPGALHQPPKHRNSSVVRDTCNQPTTDVRLVEFTDSTTRWVGVCESHRIGPLG